PAAGRRLLGSGTLHLEAIRASDVRIEVSGDLACKTSRFETRSRAPETGATHLARGVHLWILRRVARDWRVALVMWQIDG
ncbi:MAG: hypothetical protein ACREMO_05355, partial [Gemmatimonadales bacterium]